MASKSLEQKLHKTEEPRTLLSQWPLTLTSYHVLDMRRHLAQQSANSDLSRIVTGATETSLEASRELYCPFPKVKRDWELPFNRWFSKNFSSKYTPRLICSLVGTCTKVSVHCAGSSPLSPPSLYICTHTYMCMSVFVPTCYCSQDVKGQSQVSVLIFHLVLRSSILFWDGLLIAFLLHSSGQLTHELLAIVSSSPPIYLPIGMGLCGFCGLAIRSSH